MFGSEMNEKGEILKIPNDNVDQTRVVVVHLMSLIRFK